MNHAESQRQQQQAMQAYWSLNGTSSHNQTGLEKIDKKPEGSDGDAASSSSSSSTCFLIRRAAASITEVNNKKKNQIRKSTL
jgi:hypothetical protein